MWAGVVAGVDSLEGKDVREEGALDMAVVGSVSGVCWRSRPTCTTPRIREKQCVNGNENESGYISKCGKKSGQWNTYMKY